MSSKFTLVILALIVICGPADAYQGLSVSLGSGYAGNLFADSFGIGNSYLAGNVSLSSTNFQRVKLKLSYDISYYEYDTGDQINNVYHVPGIALYQRNPGSRLKWGAETYIAIKDYVQANSYFDNYRIFSAADASYYIFSGLQAKGTYRLIRSKYYNFGDLNSFEHWASGELIATLPTKTTLRQLTRYSVRRFDTDDVTYHWIDTEFGISQSIDIRTGLSLSFLRRWSDGGQRPRASYYIISGITSYWDPWQGNQLEVAIKRILPWGMVSKIEGGYWLRKFSYDDYMQTELPWLRGQTGRRDEGWLARAELSRQFNIRRTGARALGVNLRGGYASNSSDDDYYSYNSFFADLTLSFRIF